MTSTTPLYAWMQWAALLPSAAVMVTGLILALALGANYRRASLLAVVGLLILLAGTFLAPLVTSAVVRESTSAGGAGQDIAIRVAQSGMIFSALRALGLASLVAAVFVDRRPPALEPSGGSSTAPLPSSKIL